MPESDLGALRAALDAASKGLPKTAWRKMFGCDAMTMAHWGLVPESFHGDPKELAKWVRKAHALALLNPKPKKPAKKN